MARTRGRPRHPKKEIEAVIQYAESRGWRVGVGGSHPWGVLLCPDRNGCQVGVHATPANAFHHARYLRHQIDGCTLVQEGS